MEVYKRKIMLNKFEDVDGNVVIPTNHIQLYLTQTIEDLGIYEDVEVTDNEVSHDDPGELDTDRR